MAVVSKILMGIGLKLLSEKVIEDLILFAFEKLSQSTKTKVDDELLKIVKDALGKND